MEKPDLKLVPKEMAETLDGRQVPVIEKGDRSQSNLTPMQKEQVKVVEEFTEQLRKMNAKFLISFAFPKTEDSKDRIEGKDIIYASGLMAGGTQSEINLLMKNAVEVILGQL